MRDGKASERVGRMPKGRDWISNERKRRCSSDSSKSSRSRSSGTGGRKKRGADADSSRPRPRWSVPDPSQRGGERRRADGHFPAPHAALPRRYSPSVGP